MCVGDLVPKHMLLSLFLTCFMQDELFNAFASFTLLLMSLLDYTSAPRGSDSVRSSH